MIIGHSICKWRVRSTLWFTSVVNLLKRFNQFWRKSTHPQPLLRNLCCFRACSISWRWLSSRTWIRSISVHFKNLPFMLNTFHFWSYPQNTLHARYALLCIHDITDLFFFQWPVCLSFWLFCSWLCLLSFHWCVLYRISPFSESWEEVDLGLCMDVRSAKVDTCMPWRWWIAGVSR